MILVTGARASLPRVLGWRASYETFASSFRKTAAWYIANRDGVAQVVSAEYQNWVATNLTGGPTA